MTNVRTLELELQLPTNLHDLFVAELDAAGFTGFIQDDVSLKSYIPLSLWTTELKQWVKMVLQQHNVSTLWQEKEIAPQDWNKLWEESIQPIKIPPFYIRPSWAEPIDGLIDIIVDPKMSFGTGHHETTRLLLKMMPDFLKAGSRVLDAGTGTAILAIAAVKLNAASALAFDIDPWVSENVQENLKLNEVVQSVTYREGAIDIVPEAGFDVVFANINRNVLLAYLADFAVKITSGGYLFLSGILVEDKPLMENAAADIGFSIVAEDREGAWWAGVFVRGNSSVHQKEQ